MQRVRLKVVLVVLAVLLTVALLIARVNYDLPVTLNIVPLFSVIVFAYVWQIKGGVLAGFVASFLVILEANSRGVLIEAGSPLFASLVAYPSLGLLFGVFFHRDKERRKSVRNLQALYGAANALYRSESIEGICEEVTRILVEDLSSLRAVVFKREADNLYFYVGYDEKGLLSDFKIYPDSPECLRTLDSEQVLMGQADSHRLCVPRDGESSRIVLPLSANEDKWGILMIDSRESLNLTEAELSVLDAFAEYVSIAVEKAKLLQKTQELLKEKEQLAVTDGLTGLYNHGYFKERLREEVKRQERFGGRSAVLMMDIDDFKQVNDRYGHLAGDQVLKRLAEILKEHLREVDVVCRYGGEEFATILPETDSEAAFMVAERIRKEFSQESFEESLIGSEEKESFNRTISIGIGIYPDDNGTWDGLINVADERLYQAKRNGKNQVVWES